MKVTVPPPATFRPFEKKSIEQSIAACFESQVQQTPGRLAIKTETAALTYQQLNDRANQIAHTILEKAGREGKVVALLFEPTIAFVTALFGVLKAGKAFVPIDPSYPQARASYLLQDSLAELILTNHKNFPTAQTYQTDKIQIINVEDEVQGKSAKDLSLPISPDAPAYLIYTSGSTGKPKGVLQNQRNILHYVMTYTNATKICMDDRLSLFGSLSHAAGISDIFRAMLKGAAIFPFNLKLLGLTRLERWLIEEGITIFHSIPTVFRHFVDNLEGDENFPKIRLIHLGGEAVSTADVERYRKRFSDNCILLNNLSSTEVSIYRQFFVNKQIELETNVVPVGYPVQDKEIILVDENDRTVPPSEVGEIVVKSPYLAVAYWQRPALTKQAFPQVANEPTMRLYHTGDLGRLQPDGSLVYLGRKDSRVKIRGFRIEIAEVEATLAQYKLVKETAVITHTPAVGDKQLIAYVVPYAGQKPTTEALVHFMRTALPEYMVPAQFIFLDKLPQNANGKIDRLALSKLPLAQTEKNEAFAAPTTEHEATLVAIWEEVLGVKPIGIYDNFFTLGGHSLLATLVFAQIDKRIMQGLPITLLFQYPTIAQLAEAIERQRPSDSWSALVPIKEGGGRPPFYCVHGGAGHVFNHQKLADYLADDQPFYGVQPPNWTGHRVESPRVEALAERYVAEIRQFQPEGPYYLGGFCYGGMVAYEMAWQLQKAGQQVALLALIEPSPLDSRESLMIQHQNGVGLQVDSLPTFGLDKNLPKLIVGKVRHIALQSRQRLARLYQIAKKSVFSFYLASGAPVLRQHRDYYLMKFVTRQSRLRYRPSGTFQGKIDMFVVERSRLTNQSLGWDKAAAEGVYLCQFSTDHLGVLQEPYVREVAAALQRRLDEVQQEERPFSPSSSSQICKHL